MKKRYVKKCVECKYAKLIRSVDWEIRNEKSDFECVNSDVSYSFLEKYDFDFTILAENCRHFEPREFKKHCYICNEPFEGNVRDWKFWAHGDLEDIPVCSKRCQLKLQTVLDIQSDA